MVAPLASPARASKHHHDEPYLQILQTYIYYILKVVDIELVKSKPLLILLLNLPHEDEEREKREFNR